MLYYEHYELSRHVLPEICRLKSSAVIVVEVLIMAVRLHPPLMQMHMHMHMSSHGGQLSKR
jgi:hypothetical protein